MQRWKKLGIGLLALSAASTAGCRRQTTQVSNDAGTEQVRVVEQASRKSMAAFADEKELTAFLDDLGKAQERDRKRMSAGAKAGGEPSPPPAAAPAAEAKADGVAAGRAESVTNVQHAGVDEGGIVKVHGDHLVVLRRGRLFTINIGDGALSPISTLDAFGPGIDPGGAWYDEMLVSGDTVVVIGYSYQRGGTEVGLFDISREGKLAYRATYHLRSNDYYSSRNYASRLLGSKLVFYTPLYLRLDKNNPFASFPAIRKWHSGAKEDEFKRIVSPTSVYRPLISSPSLALHTVTVCDLAKPELECTAKAVMGPAGRVFYVSPSSVYVWMTDWQSRTEKSAPRSLVYRMPLDGSEPTALRVAGSPVDQFSFLESGDQNLNVVVRADAGGDGMWRAEVTQGDVALLRVPLASFSGTADQVASSRYTVLPKPSGYVFQNRYVGDYLLYGSGSGWGAPQPNSKQVLFAHRFAGGAPPVALEIGHGVDRIEALGSNAIVVGTDGQNLHFTPVALGERPSLAARYTRLGASQGELRSHGFFYKPDSDRSGLLGLPVREPGRPGYEHLFNDSASILFLRNDALKLSELGAMGAHPEGSVSDNCRASCVDWYGNARPLFLRGRIFALLGYEIVEGEIDDGKIHEKRRTSFAPGALAIAR